ncbi:MAG: MoxR family ATPase [Ruminococcus sp.]|nr:MoxR family ATPase [Ruminococcus sp.]
MNEKVQALIGNIEKVIVGKHDVIVQVAAALISGGHILIEDVPGVGKTQLVAALAKSVNGKFNRIQLTPDIMPSDIVGFSMINRETGEFEYRDGAAMCNFLLADEINRASAKAQSSLLEVMEEFQISLDGQTRALPKPFMTLATQNPVETYGTYHLPEAQMDRFLMRISMGYPSEAEEIEILDRNENENPIKNISPVLSTDDIIDLQEQAKKVMVSPEIKEYILRIVKATRTTDEVKLGVSPRGSISLHKAAKAYAFICGRDYVTPDDIKRLAVPVLSHRIIMTQKGKATYGTQQNYIASLMTTVGVPLTE